MWLTSEPVNYIVEEGRLEKLVYPRIAKLVVLEKCQKLNLRDLGSQVVLEILSIDGVDDLGSSLDESWDKSLSIDS